MLNFTNNSGPAKLHYGASDYMILEQGSYVLCAVTSKQIPLDELKYWNDDLQEAYADAASSTQRLLESKP